MPIIISQLIRIPVGNWTIAGEGDWVGFLGSYIGAILGGIISGALTLGGVILTINHQKRQRFIDEYPHKRMLIDDVIDDIDDIFVCVSEDFSVIEDVRELFRIASIMSEDDELLERASGVSGKFYKLVKDIRKECTQIVNCKIYSEDKWGVSDLDDEKIRRDILLERVGSIKVIYYQIKQEADKLDRQFENMVF